jgi:hypothetical protein
MGELKMDLAQRVRRLEDIEAIKQLKFRYCEICDDDHNPELITTVFSDDAVWEGVGIGKASGHGEIRKLFESFQKAISFSQHIVNNPIIEVDGDSASARWYFFGTFTYYEGGVRRWQSARYHEQYVRTSDGWKIGHLEVMDPVFSARFEKGWQNGLERSRS